MRLLLTREMHISAGTNSLL